MISNQMLRNLNLPLHTIVATELKDKIEYKALETRA